MSLFFTCQVFLLYFFTFIETGIYFTYNRFEVIDLQRLKELRKARALTQRDIADMLGVNRTTYTKYESDASEPPLETLYKLADYFDVSLDYLLEKSDIKNTPAPEGLTDAEEQLLQAFRKLNDIEKSEVLNFVRFIQSKN